MASTYAILKKQDVFNEEIDRDNLFSYLSGVYPINISKELEDVIREYVLPENFYSIGKIVRSILDTIEGTDLIDDRIDTNVMRRDIAVLMGKEQAEQYVRLLALYGRQYTDSYSMDLYEKLIHTKTVTIKDLIVIILLFVTFMYDIYELDEWFKRVSYKSAPSFNGAISYDNSVRNLLLKPEDITSAGILVELPLEEKQNIIGSLWNCIIDIIVDRKVNGERSEQ